MRPMQDKDFDQLFKERFEAFEVNPSASVWQKISTDLDTPAKKKRKTFAPYWMAAASVVLLTSAVLWLNKPGEVIKLQGRSEGLAVVKQGKAVTREIEDAGRLVIEEPSPKEIIGSEAQNTRTFKSARSVRAERTQVKERALPERVSHPTPNAEEVLLATQQVTIEAKKPVIAPVNEEREVVMAQVADNEVDVYEESGNTNPRIKSIGGLVNFVVAQVDKRDDKIIEFKDGTEGSTVSGINIGPLRFKSRN